mmetsp:Transcript_13813/g.17486  ORF Transcript_13813/g.17486 Transcript_13813/m.17486 type:complete len:100 (-) Transcript_13813:626-925(-)
MAEERAKQVQFYVAVSCFDQCAVKILYLVYNKGKFEFGTMNTLINCHVAPIGKVRLSKQHPRLLVTCGFERDCYLKLWNISAKAEKGESAKCLHQLSTS